MGERRRAGELSPAAKKFGAEMAGEITASWFGPPAGTESRKPVDQSQLARLKREDQRDEDRMHEIIATRQERAARIDELETEQHRQSWNEADTGVDEYDDETDVAGIFDDNEAAAEPAAELSPLAQEALSAMDPLQRSAFERGV